ncbi:hypothetical protein E2C01_040468 [Portunus trituberculatus]|uniref:Uncharacterized protein n=1 Tax=Portunus trituberculatus TaxID=210409 RepID=A0A5B7FNV6_PORTR|nr:hypothetical protein [Portunus trituberculatus]
MGGSSGSVRRKRKVVSMGLGRRPHVDCAFLGIRVCSGFLQVSQWPCLASQASVSFETQKMSPLESSMLIISEQTVCSVGSPASPLLSLSPAETQIH